MTITGVPKVFAWRSASEKPQELTIASSNDAEPLTLLSIASESSVDHGVMESSSVESAFVTPSTFTDTSTSAEPSDPTEIPETASVETTAVATATSTPIESLTSTQQSTTQAPSSSQETVEMVTSTLSSTSEGSSSFSETSLQASTSLLTAESTSTSISLSSSSIPPDIQHDHYHIDENLHRIVYSTSTKDRQYFDISWHANGSYNTNILPHPTMPDQYVLVAQLQQNREAWMTGTHAMHCIASFVDEVLTCNEPPQSLPIEWTPDTYCPGDPYPGPHDPRILYGPNSAFVMYGSRSALNCHGMWVQDLQHLLPEFTATSLSESFPSRIDIQRPPPYREIEKNYFLFWDHDNNTYVHHDISPGRVFAPLYPNGAVGPNLALLTTNFDTPCLNRYMPNLSMRNESDSSTISYETIHQTANSLSITLCNRADSTCQPSPSNTFIMSIFNHKTFYSRHAEYFPYIMLFQQAPPFAVHAISTKSIWVNGRSRLSNQSPSPFWRAPEDVLPDHSELFFVVSMAWKSRDQMYHGYVDDEMILGLGIEDFTSAGIDVLARDLLQDLGHCEGVEGRPETVFEGEIAV